MMHRVRRFLILKFPASDFYKQVNDLYQASKVLTTDQKNQALFWRDVPGVSTPGHWMSITQQAIRQSHSRLDKAAGCLCPYGNMPERCGDQRVSLQIHLP